MGDTMGDIAIFTPEIAEELIARGYKLIAQTKKAYYFEDSAQLRLVVIELLDMLNSCILR